MSKPDFMTRPWHLSAEWTEFMVGSVRGLYRPHGREYQILSLISDDPGNGDFEHTMRWFYASCKRDGYDLRVMDIMNKGLGRHLLSKRNFMPVFGTHDMKLEHGLMP